MNKDKKYRLLMQTRFGSMYSYRHDSYWHLYWKMIQYLAGGDLVLPDNSSFRFRDGELRKVQEERKYSIFHPPILKN